MVVMRVGNFQVGSAELLVGIRFSAVITEVLEKDSYFGPSQTLSADLAFIISQMRCCQTFA